MNNVIVFIRQIYSAVGITNEVNSGDVVGLLLLLFIIISGIIFWATGRKIKVAPTLDSAKPQSEDGAETPVSPEEITPSSEEVPTKSWIDRLRDGLSRSRSEVWGKFGQIFSGGKLDEEKLEQIEELLYGSDMGPEMVTELIEQISKDMDSKEMTLDDFKQFLFNFLEQKMGDVQSQVNQDLYTLSGQSNNGPKVIMVVGVNGAGKTTTIGKLATKLKRMGAKVVVGACDTFRAAAVDQLEVWCKRADVEMVRAKEGANPSGVGYDALQKAINEKADYCILDTAGRLHTKENLMEELKKMKRVLLKLDESAPHEVLLVIDAVTGQNAMRQAEEFHKALNLTGLIFTKCDGSSKAGGAVGIVHKLRVPITYIGVGEDVEDLNIFDQKEYLTTLLDIESH